MSQQVTDMIRAKALAPRDPIREAAAMDAIRAVLMTIETAIGGRDHALSAIQSIVKLS